MSRQNELSRIKDVYTERSKRDVKDRYSIFLPGELYMLQRREARALALLRQAGITTFEENKILEIGCGCGQRLVDFLRWGARAENLYGMDLMYSFVHQANEMLPGAHFFQGSGDVLPFADQSFDVISQSTVFTSILDNDLRRSIAAEMQRVLKKNGVILWYDFRYPSPGNRNVTPLKRREIQALFPDCEIRIQSSTLLPPLARKVAAFSTLVCQILETFPPLRSHYLAVIKPSERYR